MPPRQPFTFLGLLARIGPFLDTARTVLVSGALVLLLLLVGWTIAAEARREAIVVERIAVPRSIGEHGLEGEVLASRLVDAIARASEAAFWRGERRAVAPGWKTEDFQVPLLGLSMAALVRIVEDLVGRPDRRVSGELVVLDGRPTLRLRIGPPQPGAGPIVRPILDPASEAAVDRALDAVALDLLERIDPLALAAHLLVLRFERGESDPRRAPGEPERAPLDAVVEAVNRCLLDPRCRSEEAGQAYGLWGEALHRAAIAPGEIDPSERCALLEEALAKLDLAARSGEPALRVALRRARVLLDLDRREEALDDFARIAARHPDSASALREWARALARLGRPQEAAAKLEAALGLAPEDPWIRFELGSALEAAGRAEAARAAFRQAVERDGALHCALEGWARTLAGTEREAERRHLLERARRLRGDQPPCRWPDP